MNVKNYETLPASRVTPEGWAAKFLERQETGLTGNPAASGFPYNTGMWTEQMDVKNREYPEVGQDWWPYEQTAYYLDGALRCGYLNKSKALLDKVRENIKSALENAGADGGLGPRNVQDDLWCMVIFMRMLLEEYLNTEDRELLQAIERYYQQLLKQKEIFANIKGASFSIRKVLHVETLCQLAALTDNKEYLEEAETIYRRFCRQAGEDNPLTAPAMRAGVLPAKHAVTFHEFLKLPAVLFYYTAEPAYREAFERALQGYAEEHELVDGLGSASEALDGKGFHKVHETCNVSDFIWAVGWGLQACGEARYADKMEKVLYNAGFSSVTSDFKAHQYYGGPNLPVSMDGSSNFNDKSSWGQGAKGRLCYRPGHDTECCTGNIHRMLPCFIKNMWLLRERELSAVFYMPSMAEINIDPNNKIRIQQKTAYPFDDQVRFKFYCESPQKLNFRMRIPGWCRSYSLDLNDERIDSRHSDESHFTNLENTFEDGDEVTLTLKTEPRVEENNQSITFYHGPLLFSLPIEAKTTYTTNDGAGKCSRQYPAMQLWPRSEWRYGFAEPPAVDEIEVIKKENAGYPWDFDQSPIMLKVPRARLVTNWNKGDHITIPQSPADPDLDCEEHTLTLKPMGATMLRISEFPVSY